MCITRHDVRTPGRGCLTTADFISNNLFINIDTIRTKKVALLKVFQETFAVIGVQGQAIREIFQTLFDSYYHDKQLIELLEKYVISGNCRDCTYLRRGYFFVQRNSSEVSRLYDVTFIFTPRPHVTDVEYSGYFCTMTTESNQLF